MTTQEQKIAKETLGFVTNIIQNLDKQLSTDMTMSYYESRLGNTIIGLFEGILKLHRNELVSNEPIFSLSYDISLNTILLVFRFDRKTTDSFCQISLRLFSKDNIEFLEQIKEVRNNKVFMSNISTYKKVNNLN